MPRSTARRRLPKGVLHRFQLANGNITRYRLETRWFIDRSTGPHKHPLWKYTVYEPGAGSQGGAECRGGAATLSAALVVAAEEFAKQDRLNSQNKEWVRGTAISYEMVGHMDDTHGQVGHPGYISGNIAIFRDPRAHRIFPWQIKHQPSGRRLASGVTLKRCKEAIGQLRACYDFSFMDRCANPDGTDGTLAEGDDKVIAPFCRSLKSLRGISAG